MLDFATYYENSFMTFYQLGVATKELVASQVKIGLLSKEAYKRIVGEDYVEVTTPAQG
ncbi:XkdX family protein [Lactobacillus jensenii]|jgi:hypothetical protein|uniref:XkdX family protein n=1 Tax=Myoviridae sp. ctk251 TaxID=2826689 RepID=A0A8S5MTP1_9CAUD|nr:MULTISPECIES: XkdX family protein [Lactobacillus]DAD85315.1 MAG TPA: hypothetical protein [Myoviridae sp. ctk251]DAM38217.1 MAG TPA: hypothetical protein [Caudoviricetes sp.]EEX27718.1 putative XkdX family protein [Lactobacillus jensenii SJ-7A-US]MCF1778420.1 XkdX family protein [Lactobacillus jensenii]MCF1797567.1 XkdX family protein [Lactobacillus mulieris]